MHDFLDIFSVRLQDPQNVLPTRFAGLATLLTSAAECLGLEWVEEGRGWDNVNRRFREVAVLGIWGEENMMH